MRDRCLHQQKGVCPACRAFNRALVATVRTRKGWTPGIMGRLSRGARRAL